MRLDEILTTHLIEPAHLRGDEFDDFITHRAMQLLDMIEKAMGKTVSGRDSDDVMKAFGITLVKQVSTP